ncbi:MAG: sulfate adenylyltransferase [Candidatus Rokuibacteriota bacterium]|nr:MAG: sulfate adenylyltransferase [Candidatus Rokubacteria bacterium]
MDVEIPPHGGRLTDRILRGDALRDARERIGSLKRIALNARMMSDLELLAVGAYSPLQGFMGEKDYRAVLHGMRLADGLPWPLPITLAVRRRAADTVREGEQIALVTPWEEPLGILHVEERFPYDGREEARVVYGTDDPSHPGAQYQLTRGDVLLSGPVDMLARPPLKGFDAYRLDPDDARARFRQLGWRTVVGFQSHQPMHRAHEYIQKCALEPLDGLFIHPLVGQTKLDELPSEVRVRCYQVLVEQYYPQNRALLAVFPGAIRYAGPRETLFHALVRKNYGCTHFIVGREYAGIESTFAPITVDEIFNAFTPAELGITPLFFDETFYCRRCEAVTSPKTCPHGAQDRMALSGAVVRELLGRGELVPTEFARPEVAEILRNWVRGADVATAPAAPSTAPKETKAQRAERLKRESNPWENLETIRRFARDGYQSIPAAWLNTYFRWWGAYTQGDGIGAVGGKSGEGKAVPYFMVRIRIPNGQLFSHQLRTIAQFTERSARGHADITVRENIQLHWVPIEDLPDLFENLSRAGLATMGTCGDVTRNITGCPVAGVDADELIDASPLVQAATRMLNGNPDFYNLPRKYKITITGCRAWCAYPEINDVGLTAVRHPQSGEVGFALRVGGGLSTHPHLALPLNAFVRFNQVLPVIRGISEIFRDSDALRQDREKARLKFLFLQHGWTAERFQDELERRIGFALEPAVAAEPPDDVYRDHVGLHPQKQPGYVYAGVAVLRGRLTAEQMRIMADLADRYGSGELRTTTMQNLLILNVRRERADDLAREIEAAGLRLQASPFWRGTIACTGTEFCKLALTETKGFARWLVEEMETRMPGFDQHLKIHVTGCPNSCGQHWIADLGIEGKKTKVEGTMVDAYYFCVGGGVGRHQRTARPIGYRAPATEVPDAIERVLRAYLADRRNGDSFRAFTARHTDEELREWLAGRVVAGVARDAPAGRAPHGVDG